MSIAVRINVDSTIEEISIDNIIHTLQTQTAYPYDEYRLLERYELEDDMFMYIYGMVNLSYPINHFEFQYFNMTGDAFALLVTNEGEFLDLPMDEFCELYQEEIDLDVTIDMDDLTSSEDTYDFDSDFYEDDR